jgi:hypothetical protein
MELVFDPQTTSAPRVNPDKTDAYTAFRESVPKPPAEEEHLRHILRFYITRAMLKKQIDEIYVLPEIQIGDQTLKVDLLAVESNQTTLAICEPDSITPETEDMLEVLKDVDNIHVIVVHSQYGKPGNVAEKFGSEIENKKFKVMAVVPPPFDDTYEYDIWMFDLTFRDLFAGD